MCTERTRRCTVGQWQAIRQRALCLSRHPMSSEASQHSTAPAVVTAHAVPRPAPMLARDEPDVADDSRLCARRPRRRIVPPTSHQLLDALRQLVPRLPACVVGRALQSHCAYIRQLPRPIAPSATTRQARTPRRLRSWEFERTKVASTRRLSRVRQHASLQTDHGSVSLQWKRARGHLRKSERGLRIRAVLKGRWNATVPVGYLGDSAVTITREYVAGVCRPSAAATLNARHCWSANTGGSVQAVR